MINKRLKFHRATSWACPSDNDDCDDRSDRDDGEDADDDNDRCDDGHDGDGSGDADDDNDGCDDGNDADGNLVDDETRIDFTVDPAVEVLKTGVLVDNGDNLPGVGDTAVFTIVVTNKGNTALTSITLTEIFKRGNIRFV